MLRRLKPLWLCLLLGVLAVGYYFYDEYDITGQRAGVSGLPDRSGDLSMLEVLDQDAALNYRLQYTCGHEVLYTPEEMTSSGLDFLVYDLERVVPAMQGQEGAVISGHLPLPCPDCRNKYLICELDGYVAVYRGHVKEAAVLVQRYTDMPVALLPEDVQQRLREGIPVSSNEELARVIEGLDG